VSNNMQEEPNSPETTPTGTPPNETLDQRLKRLSQEGHPSGKFVKGSNLGPISIFSTPQYAPPTSERKPWYELTRDELMEQAYQLCLLKNPTLTKEEFMEMSEAHGF
jgi:hypothetical protein